MIAPLSLLFALAGQAMLQCEVVVDSGRIVVAENDDMTMK